MKRVFLIILDSFGIGAMEDAASYGDVDVNTLRTVSSSPFFHFPNMRELGFFQIEGTGQWDRSGGSVAPKGLVARMTERSKGKDTTIGHWEIAGVYSPRPLPTYPEGFPEEVLDAFRENGKRRTL